MGKKIQEFNLSKAVTPTLFDYDKMDYSKNYFVTNYGDNFYNEVIDLVEQSPITKNLINNIVKRIVGKGIYDKNTGKKQVGLTELLKKITIDYIYFNQISIKCDWNVPHTKVLDVKHFPIKNIRHTEDDQLVVACDNWTRKNKKPVAFQTLNPNMESDSEQMFIHKTYTVDNRIYPLPFWFSCKDYIVIDHLIGTGLLNNMNNNLTTSFIISVNNGEMSDDEIDELYNSIKKNYSGQDNSGGFILLNSSGIESKPEIIAFPSNQNKENYEFINTIATQKILQGFSITSPILVGVEEAGRSLSNGTEAEVMNEIFMNTNIIPLRSDIWSALEQVLPYTTIDINELEILDGDFYTEKEKEIEKENNNE